MSVENWLTDYADVERNTPTKDALAGQVDVWATYTWNSDTGETTESVPCLRTPLAAADARNESPLGRPDAQRDVTWAFGEDYGMKVGDRIKFTDPRSSSTNYYMVIGPGINYYASAISSDAVYSVTTRLKVF